MVSARRTSGVMQRVCVVQLTVLDSSDPIY